MGEILGVLKSMTNSYRFQQASVRFLDQLTTQQSSTIFSRPWICNIILLLLEKQKGNKHHHHPNCKDSIFLVPVCNYSVIQWAASCISCVIYKCTSFICLEEATGILFLMFIRPWKVRVLKLMMPMWTHTI